MYKIINNIFEHYGYVELQIPEVQNVHFFKKNDTSIANYFIIYSIDCREIESNEKLVKQSMDRLERIYAKAESANTSLKEEIKNLFDDTQEASQLDKNTSAIYLMLFNDISRINNYRNLVYSIEESPNYFKRYVLPYTGDQICNLNLSLSQFPEKTVVSALNDMVDNKDDYFNLLEQNNLDNNYGLVVRMFSKLPFLQYDFNAESAPEPIMKTIESNLSHEVKPFHELLFEDELSIDKIYNIVDEVTLTSDELEKLLVKELKGVKL